MSSSLPQRAYFNAETANNNHDVCRTHTLKYPLNVPKELAFNLWKATASHGKTVSTLLPDSVGNFTAFRSTCTQITVNYYPL